MKVPTAKREAWLTQKSLYHDNAIDENSMSDADSVAATVKGKKDLDKGKFQSMNEASF